MKGVITVTVLADDFTTYTWEFERGELGAVSTWNEQGRDNHWRVEITGAGNCRAQARPRCKGFLGGLP